VSVGTGRRSLARGVPLLFVGVVAVHAERGT